MSTNTGIVYGNETLQLKTESVTEAKAFTASDSGKLFTLNSTAGKAHTLPAPIKGFKMKVVVGTAFSSTAHTITSSTAVIQGGAIVNSVNVPAANENTITFSASAETVGDWLEIVSDGVNWYVNGVGTAAGAITFTVV